MTENEVGDAIIAAAMKVHSAVGPGLLEGAYRLCLGYELTQKGVSVQHETMIQIRYGEFLIEHGYRIDLLVDDRVVVALKALETILPVHRAQLLSYLRLGGFKLGYLLNFNVAHMREGITRMVNGL